MQNSLKRLAIALRNRISPTNTFRRDRKATFKSAANILRTRIDIKGASEVVLEQGVRLRNAELLVRGNANSLVIEKGSKFSGRIELFGDGNMVRIGENTVINGALLVAHNSRKLHIGGGCLFSHGGEVRTTDSHRIFAEGGLRINEDRDILIGDEVWLGVGVLVLKGSIIGSGGVVGARSVVRSDLPPNSLAVGSPARVVKKTSRGKNEVL